MSLGTQVYVFPLNMYIVKLLGHRIYACVSFQLLFTSYVMSDSLRPYGLQPARLLCPWDFPSKNTGVGYHFLIQGIFPDQGSNPCLLPQQVNSLPLCYLRSPTIPICFPKWLCQVILSLAMHECWFLYVFTSVFCFSIFIILLGMQQINCIFLYYQ